MTNDTESTAPADETAGAPAPYDPSAPVETTGPTPDEAQADPDAPHPAAGDLIDPDEDHAYDDTPDEADSTPAADDDAQDGD